MSDFNLDLEFSATGADAVTGLLEQVYKGTAKVVGGNDNLVESSVKVEKATQNLSAQIERAILSYADSKSQVLAYTAAQLGQTQAMAGQLAMLVELETHMKNANEAFAEQKQQKREMMGLEQDLAREVQRRLKEEEAATLQLARINEQALAARKSAAAQELASRNAYYSGIIADAKRADDATTTSRHNAILATQDATKQFVALERDAQQQASALAEKQAIDEINWMNKSVKERIRILQELKQYQSNGDISSGTIDNKFSSAAQNDLPRLTRYQTDYNAEVAKTVSAHDKLKSSGKPISEMWQDISLNTNRARTELIVIAHEMLQGRFSRVPGSMMVLAESSNIATLAMSAVGLTVIGTTLAVAGLLFAIAKGALEFEKMNAALIQTGGYSGLTTAGFYEMADSLVAVEGNIGHAKETLLLLANSGRFTKDEIDVIAPAILEMAHNGGIAVDTLVKQFEQLAKNPVAASKELNEQYHYLTATIYEQITALVQQGDKLGAMNLAESTYAEATKNRALELGKNLGTLTRAWHFLADEAAAGWNAMMGIGRPTNINDKLDVVKKQIEMASDKLKDLQALRGDDSLKAIKNQQAKLATLWAEQAALTATKDDGILAQQTKADRAQSEQAAIAAFDRRAAMEKRNFTPLQKRQVGGAEIYQDDATEIANALGANGVSQATLNAATKTIDLGVHATTEMILNAAKQRYLAVVKLAEDNGKDLLISQESTNQRLLNVDVKHHDKKVAAIKENSNVEFAAFVQDQDREFAAIQKITDRKIRETERGFNSDKKLADDALAIARVNSATTNSLHIADTSVYVAYVDNVVAVRQKAVDSEKQLLQEQLAAGIVKGENIVAEAQSEVRLYTDGQTRLNSAVKKAKDDRLLLEQTVAQKIDEINQRSLEVQQEAESKALKESTVDIDAKIQAMLKLIDTREKELAKVGLTKTAIRDLADQEAKAIKVKTELEIQALLVEQQANSQNSVTVKLYQDKIDALTKYGDISLKIVDANTKLKASQEDWEKGARQGLTDYLDSTDNVFKTAQGLVTKSFKGMEDALVTFVTTGKLSFKSMVNSIISDLARIVIQQNIMRPLAQYLGLGGGSGSGASAGGGGAVSAVAQGATSGLGGAFNMASSAFGAATNATALGVYGGMGELSSLGFTEAISSGFTALTSGVTGSVAAGLGTLAGVLGPIALGVAVLSSLMGDKLSASKSTGSLNRSFDAQGNITSSSSPFALGNGEEAVQGLQNKFAALQGGLGATGGSSFGYGAYDGNGGKNPHFAITGGGFNSGEVATTPDALNLASERAILSALQLSDMPAALSKILNGVVASTASLAQIQAAETAALALSVGIKTLTAAMEFLPFEQLKGMAFETAAALVEASGGLQALSANLTSYQQNFYSAEEQRAQKVADITRALNGAGVGVTADQIATMTREQYRALVEGIGTATAANAPMLAALYATSAAFAAITPASIAVSSAIATISQTMQNLQANTANLNVALMRAQGNASGADVGQRTIDTAGYTDAETAIYDYNKALQVQIDTLTTAASQAAQVAQQRSGLETQLLQLQGDTVELRKRELAALDPANRSIKEMIYALEDAAKAAVVVKSTTLQLAQGWLTLAQTNATAAYTALDKLVTIEKQRLTVIRDVAQQTVTTITGVFTLLRDQVTQLYGSVSSTATDSAQSGQDFIDQALATAKSTGYLPDQQALQKAIAAVTAGQSGTQYASQVAADRDRLVLAGKLSQLQDIGGRQLSAAQDQLDATKAQLDALDQMLANYKSQLDALTTINDSILTIPEALKALANAIAQGRAAVATVKDSTSTNVTDQQIHDYAVPLLGNAAGDRQVYDAAYANRDRGVTLASIDRAAGLQPGEASAWAIANGLPVFAVGTNYVPKDTLAFLHQGEAVVPKAFNPAATPQTIAADSTNDMKSLRQDMRSGQIVMADLLRTFTKITQKWDGEGMPAVRT
jgi:lambda family phage tail tape measure protein